MSKWCRMQSASKLVGPSGRPVHLIGEGVPYHRASLPSDASVIVTDEFAGQARAAAVAALGRAMAQRGEFSDPFQLTPIYVRLPEAEEKRLAAEDAVAAAET